MPYRSRKQMEAIIASGASVMLPAGGVATRLEELPTEARLAKLDAAEAEKLALDPKVSDLIRKLADQMKADAALRDQAAKDELKAKIEALQAELAAAQAQAVEPRNHVQQAAEEPAPDLVVKQTAPVSAAQPVARPGEPPKAPEKK